MAVEGVSLVCLWGKDEMPSYDTTRHSMMQVDQAIRPSVSDVPEMKRRHIPPRRCGADHAQGPQAVLVRALAGNHKHRQDRVEEKGKGKGDGGRCWREPAELSACISAMFSDQSAPGTEATYLRGPWSTVGTLWSSHVTMCRATSDKHGHDPSPQRTVRTRYGWIRDVWYGIGMVRQHGQGNLGTSSLGLGSWVLGPWGFPVPSGVENGDLSLFLFLEAENGLSLGCRCI